MPRRPWFLRVNIFAALERLRSFIWRDRIGSLFTRRASSRKDDAKLRKTTPEVRPLDYRNPPSESIGTTALPLAATAAAVAAVAFLADSQAAASEARFSSTTDGAGKDYDTSFHALGGGGGGGGDESGGGSSVPILPNDSSWLLGGSAFSASADLSPTSENASSSSAAAPLDLVSGNSDTFRTPTGGADSGSDTNPATAGNINSQAQSGANSSVSLDSSVGSASVPATNSTASSNAFLSSTTPPVKGSKQPAATTNASRPAVHTAQGQTAATKQTGSRSPGSVADDLSNSGMTFVSNAGQWDSSVDFGAQGNGYQAWFTGGDAILALGHTVKTAHKHHSSGTASVVYDAVKLNWNGISPNAHATGQGQLSSTSNFMAGSDSSQWQTNVSEFSSIDYANAWKGIDLVYHRSDANGLEYDLDVHPGANLSEVSFRVQGAKARIHNGSLILTTPDGAKLVENAPKLYQVNAKGKHHTVHGRFTIHEDGSIGFTVGKYNTRRELTVDPSLNYTTTLGGTGTSAATGVTTDSSGNAYVVGYTSAPNFPTTPGAYKTTLPGYKNTFVTKLNSSGNIVWSTFLGGTNASTGDAANNGVALGPNGNVYVTGYTTESNFPTTAGAFQTTYAGSPPFYHLKNAYLSVLSSSGSSLLYSTYLGGAGPDEGLGVAVDPSSGQAVVVGYTQSSNFPTRNAYQSSRIGGQDGFVTRFNSTLSSLVYSTYWGTSGTYTADSVALDSAGEAIVAGGSASSGAIARFSATGSLDGSRTYGSGYANGVALDSFDHIYVTGSGFTAKFNSLNQSPVYSISSGGNGIAVDSAGRAVVVGTSSGALSVTRYKADGSGVDWSASSSAGTTGNSAAVDPSSNMYAAGIDSTGGNALVLKYANLPAAPSITTLVNDTGYSSTDWVTSANSPQLVGTAPANASVTIFRDGPIDPTPVSVGSVTAAASGLWTFTYSPTLADGVYAFTANDTVSGVTSPYSAPASVTIDTTAPTVNVSVVSQSYDVHPRIVVTVSDPLPSGGFPPTATVTLDATPGGTGYATATLVNGQAVFTNYTAFTPGTTVQLQARITDAAGNQGTSANSSVQILTSPTSWTTTSATPSIRGGYGGMWNWSTPMNGMLYAGNITTSHPLDLSVTAPSCGCQNAALVYNSQEANPSPVVQALVQSNNAVGLPSNVYGTLTWDGVAGSTINYNLSQLSSGGQWVFGAQPTSSLSTGRHTYTLSLAFVSSGGTINRSVTGSTFIVNRSSSPYGAGWSFSNTDTLVSIAADTPDSLPAGVLREFGRGGWGFYQSNGSGYISPAGDGGTLAASGGGWLYTSASGKVETFNSSGQMTTWNDLASTETLTYTYDASGGVATMTSPDGSVSTFSYSGSLLSTVTAPGSRVTSFTLSGGDLTQITDPSGGTHTFTYSAHLLTGETFGAATEAYTYSNGLVASTQSGSNTAATVTPALGAGLNTASTALSNSVMASDTDSLGAPTETWFNSFGQDTQTESPDGAITTVLRDSNGYVIQTVDALGQTTTFTANAAGQVTGETLPNGKSASWTYGGANDSLTNYTDFNGGLWTYTNDANGNRLTATNPLNQTTSYSYSNGLLQTMTDALGDVTTYLYDTRRRPDGALVGGSVTGTTGYDAYGNPNTFTDALGNVTTSVYNASSQMISRTDALRNTTSYAYDAAGNLLYTTDPLGNITSYAYYPSGQQLEEIDAYGTSLARITTSVYDADNQLIATVDPLGNRTTTIYDATGRAIATVDALGHRTTSSYDLDNQLTATIDPKFRVTQYKYDTLGRQIATTDPMHNTSTTVYDANSNVVATVDPLGNITTSVYDAANELIATVDPLGNRTSYGYDAAGRQISVTDPNNHISTTIYDARGLVSATEDALGNSTTSTYDANDNLIATTDPNNHTTTTVYDADNRVIATVDALGNRTSTVYDAAGNTLASIDPLGNRTTSVYDALNRNIATIDALNNRSTTVYDANNNVIATVDARGNRSSTVYDADNRAIATIDALGNRTTTVYDPEGAVFTTVDALGNTTTSWHDGDGRLFATIDPLGDISYTGYDAAGRTVTSTDANNHTTTTVYNAAGQVIATVNPLGNRTSYSYDAAGNQITTTDPLNHVTTTSYDADNRAVAVTDPLNHTSSTVYDAAGNEIAAIDPLGHRTSTGYDIANRAITTTDALGNVSTTTYDAASNVIAHTDPLNHTTSTVYDADNRAIATVDALGNRTSTSYDAAGNVQTVTDANNHVTSLGYDARNMQITKTDALGNVWTTQYDALGRAWRTIDPLGRDNRTYFDAAGHVVETADGLGFRTQNVYDAAGQQIATVDPLGNRTTSGYDAAGRLITSTDANNHTTSYSYDAANNRTTLTDPDGNTTTWTYDAANRVTEETDPTGANTTYAYDADNNQISTTDRLGRRIDTSYDSDNRQTGQNWYATGGSFLQTLTWTYDAAGRMLTAQSPGGNYTFTYDADNRVTTSAEPFGASLTFSYDNVGNRVGITDSGGGVTTIGYNAVNQQTSESIGGTGLSKLQQLRSYDAAGELTLETRQAWVSSAWSTVGTTSYAYDTDGRETAITNFTSGSSVMSSYVYAYDADSRLTSETDNGSQRTYTYDATSQLTSDAGTAYSYDSNGNRNMTGYSTGADNRMSNDGLWTYTYDADGNIIKKSKGASSDTWVYTYNNNNQMVSAAYSATNGGVVTDLMTYVYDAFGNKIERDEWNGSTTTVQRYALDGWNPAKQNVQGNDNFDTWADLNSSNAITMRRGFGPAIDELMYREDSSGNVGWYLTDHLGSVRGITDGSGNPLTTLSYDAWGNVLSNSNSSQSDRYLRAGAQYDSSTGLWQQGSRFSDGSGTWMSVDPLGLPAGPNLYEYVNNSPTNTIDPSGLFPPLPPADIAAGVKQAGSFEAYLKGGNVAFQQVPPAQYGDGTIKINDVPQGNLIVLRNLREPDRAKQDPGAVFDNYLTISRKQKPTFDEIANAGKAIDDLQMPNGGIMIYYQEAPTAVAKASDFSFIQFTWAKVDIQFTLVNLFPEIRVHKEEVYCPELEFKSSNQLENKPNDISKTTATFNDIKIRADSFLEDDPTYSPLRWNTGLALWDDPTSLYYLLERGYVDAMKKRVAEWRNHNQWVLRKITVIKRFDTYLLYKGSPVYKIHWGATGSVAFQKPPSDVADYQLPKDYSGMPTSWELFPGEGLSGPSTIFHPTLGEVYNKALTARFPNQTKVKLQGK
jgi:RHS repeat-associated protein